MKKIKTYVVNPIYTRSFGEITPVYGSVYYNFKVWQVPSLLLKSKWSATETSVINISKWRQHVVDQTDW
jgi:hypothetical protein